MVTVPYSATPSVPSGGGSVSPAYQSGSAATPDAFGAQAWKAVENVGKSVEDSAKMLEKHVIAEQTLVNQSSARDLDNQYLVDLAKLSAEYKSKQGKDAIDSAPEYEQKVMELRERYKGLAPNAMVGKLFDDVATRRGAFALSEGAAYRANQTKAYNNQTLGSSLQLNTRAASAVSNDKEFDAYLTRIEGDAAQMELGNGAPPEKAELAKVEATSKAVALRVQTLAMTDPLAAKTFFDKYSHKVDGVQVPQIQQYIKQGLLTVQADRFANNAVSGQGGGEDVLKMRESGNNHRIVNDVGFVGTYQFGAPRLETLGVFKSDVDLKGWNGKAGKEDKWQGSFNIPGMPEIKTVQDFKNSKEAQDRVRQLDLQQTEKDISAKGLDKYIGQTVAGVPITKQSIMNMAHLGGIGGAEAFLKSDGQKNPTDKYGTSLRDYAEMGSTAKDRPKLTPNTTGPELQQMIDEGKKQAVLAAGGDKDLAAQLSETVESKIKNKFNNVMATKNLVERDNTLAIKNFVLFGGQDKKPPVSMSEVTDNPSSRDIYFGLQKSNPDLAKALVKHVETNAEPDTVEQSAAALTRFQELQGMAVTSPDKFIKMNVLDEQLPKAWKTQLVAAQISSIKKPMTDKQAVSITKDILSAAEIEKETPAYNQFVGALHVKIEDYRTTNKGAAPSDDQVKIMASDLIREKIVRRADPAPQTSFDKIFGWNKPEEKMRSFEVPKEDSATIKEAYKKRWGIDPDDATVFKIYRQKAK